MLFTMELDAEVLRAFIQEARVLYSLRQHPNLLRCLGVAIMPPAACLVTEYCARGSLFEVLREEREREQGQQQQQQQHGEQEQEAGGQGQRQSSSSSSSRSSAPSSSSSTSSPPSFSYASRVRLMLDCVAGVGHLHRHGLVHGDIKSLNFLLTQDGVVKLGDVGEARRAGTRPPDGGPVHPTTINWAPPEVLALRASAYHPSMDMYSLGLVLNEVLTLEVPFHREPYTTWSYQDLIAHVVLGGRPPLGVGVDPRAAELAGLLEACLEGDPALRPAAPELLSMLRAHYERCCGGGGGRGIQV
jgi:serine/threonine protein kinase